MTNPRIYLGQLSCQLGGKIEFISEFCCEKRFEHYGSVVNSITATGSSNLKSQLVLEKCMQLSEHLFSYCSVCQDNSDRLLSYIHKLISSVQYVKQIAVVSDLSTEFGAWITICTLNHIKRMYPYIVVISILIKSPTPTFGVECFNSLCSLSTSLTCSNCTIIRGFSDSFLDINAHEGKGTANISLEEALLSMACDIWPTIHSNSGIMWPHGVCHFSGKVIDVRTSLHRAYTKIIAKRKGLKVSVEYHPLRSLAANLNAMHLAYVEQYPDVFASTASFSKGLKQVIVPSLNAVSMTFSSKSQELQLSSMEYSWRDIEVAFTNATPKTVWPFKGHDNSKNNSSAILSDSFNSSLLLHNISGLNRHQDNLDYKTAKQESGTATKNDNRLAAVVFLSPYGLQDVRTIHNKTRMLLATGAYTHL